MSAFGPWQETEPEGQVSVWERWQETESEGGMSVLEGAVQGHVYDLKRSLARRVEFSLTSPRQYRRDGGFWRG